MSSGLYSFVRVYLGTLACALTFAASAAYAAQSYAPEIGDPLAEPWRWRTFPELSGLSAQCMAESSNGTMWFGTVEGLWSYNGFEWTLHAVHDPWIGGVSSLCRATNGAMYVASRLAVGRLQDNGQWQRIFPNGQSRFGDIRKMAVGPDGSIWLATAWGLVHVTDKGSTLRTSPEMKSELANATGTKIEIELMPDSICAAPRRGRVPTARQRFSDLVFDHHGRIWLATDAGEILRFTPPSPGQDSGKPAAPAWELYNEDDGMVCGRMPSILVEQDDTVLVDYAQDADALNTFDGQHWTASRLTDLGLPSDAGGDLLQTRDGVVWMSGRYMLFARRDGRWRTYTKPEFPVPTARNSILQTEDGALWIAGPSTEIMRVDYQTTRWRTLRNLNFQWESPQGAEWFLGVDGRVVVRSRSDEWTSYGPEDGVIDAPVALQGTRHGEIWVAGSHGGSAAMSRFDGRTWTRYVHPDFSWGIEPRGVFEASDGSIWFSAIVDRIEGRQNRAGLLQYADGKWIHHHQPGRGMAGADDSSPATLLPPTQRPEPVGKFVMIGESRDGRMWAGRNFLVSRTQGHWEVYHPGDLPNSAAPRNAPRVPLRFGVIESMYSTRSGEFWLGTRAFGAMRYDGSRWEQFQGRNSLVANTVRSIVESSDGSIWAATDRGVSRFDGNTWTPDLLPKALDLTNDASSLKSGRDGTLWVNHATPNWNRRARPGTEAVPVGEFWTACHEYAGTPPRTTVAAASQRVPPPGNLSVFWSGTAPWRESSESELQYSYRLDGQEWSPYTSATGHSFFTLTPGEHRLEVRSRDRDFNVDPTPAVFEFVVLPAVWRQTWFIVLMTGLVVLLAAQTTRIFLERARLRTANRELAAEIKERQRAENELRKLNRELDHRVEDRTARLAIANKELEAFSYSVSHDLRAPLRRIDGFSRALQEDYDGKLDDEGRALIRSVRDGAERMSRLIDDLLSLSRATRGSMNIDRVDLSSLARKIADELAARSPDRKVTVEIPPNLDVIGDARFLEVALTNLLGNAWKFTTGKAEAKVEFGAITKDGERVFFVRDNGAGFSMAQVERLFRPFGRLHTEQEFPGTGIGLATVNRIVQRHGGRVWAESRVNGGATFYFTIDESYVAMSPEPHVQI